VKAGRRQRVHPLGAVDAALKERCALLHLAARIFAAAKDIWSMAVRLEQAGAK
jgi:hypothetical protein